MGAEHGGNCSSLSFSHWRIRSGRTYRPHVFGLSHTLAGLRETHDKMTRASSVRAVTWDEGAIHNLDTGPAPRQPTSDSGILEYCTYMAA